MDDFDSPWKEVLTRYFQAFLAFFFPEAHGDIDWSRPYEVLDNELRQIVREADLGRRETDLLVKVWLKSGEEVWVLIHVEVQNQVDPEFPRRMFVYYYRICDRYNREVASFALLGDDREEWRPDTFEQALWGCEARLKFPIVKLLDYAQDWQALESHANPFASVVMAHLKTRETAGHPEDRRAWKFRLVKGLFESGLAAEEIRNLFRFIDWIMSLPKPLEHSFWEDVKRLEEEKAMPYMHTGERLGYERGLEEGEARGKEEGKAEGRYEGLLLAIEENLRGKFGEPGLAWLSTISQITAPDRLRALLREIPRMTSLAELESLLHSPGN